MVRLAHHGDAFLGTQASGGAPWHRGEQLVHRRHRECLLITCLVGLLAPANAAAEADHGRAGVYLGFAGTYAIDLAIQDALRDVGIPAEVDNTLGVHGWVGYRFLPYLAVEVEVEYLTGFEAEALGFDLLEIDTLSFATNLKVPVTRGQLQPFALIGFGLLRAEFHDRLGTVGDFDDLGGSVRLGAGVDYFVKEHAYAKLDIVWVKAVGDLEDLDHLRIGWGVGYRF